MGGNSGTMLKRKCKCQFGAEILLARSCETEKNAVVFFLHFRIQFTIENVKCLDVLENKNKVNGFQDFHFFCGSNSPKWHCYSNVVWLENWPCTVWSDMNWENHWVLTCWCCCKNVDGESDPDDQASKALISHWGEHIVLVNHSWSLINSTCSDPACWPPKSIARRSLGAKKKGFHLNCIHCKKIGKFLSHDPLVGTPRGEGNSQSQQKQYYLTWN